MRARSIRALLAAGTTAHVVILHDDKCTPSRCTCTPEIVVEPLTVETLMAGSQAEADWHAECAKREAS